MTWGPLPAENVRYMELFTLSCTTCPNLMEILRRLCGEGEREIGKAVMSARQLFPTFYI